MTEPSFMDYRSALDAALKAAFDLDTYDMGLSADEIAAHQEAGETPDEVTRRYARKYGLRSL
ncbi:hypothetical protein P7D22_11495 [Lichenihabitans sp. Uapishka_5]|uniref:hypothetical protein n=1 Tax=Lichenihabitans sp. Uapishka_5 TaxID=3037302 RepID=UPI0029E801C5|nr:hypothetical protein [Lichenihabitans sp. Uapishka_5]MDX7951793.1 hypothetical protein [Lichenihabitans sp. Uapishka_5]